MSIIKHFGELKKISRDKATDSYAKEIPKVECNHTCLAVISLDSAFNKNENYYPQVLLEECKYFEKKLFNILMMTQKVLLMTLMKIRYF